MNSYEYLKKIIYTEIDSRLVNPCMSVIDDRAFREGFASENLTGKHHNYHGGLMIHTAEVMNIALNTAQSPCINVQKDIIVPAVIYHDYMKIRDYNENGNEQDYKSLIYHPQGSYAVWVLRASEANVPVALVDAVGHCILSHHGQRAWKAAVEPKLVEALIVHHADVLSAGFGSDMRVPRDNF